MPALATLTLVWLGARQPDPATSAALAAWAEANAVRLEGPRLAGSSDAKSAGQNVNSPSSRASNLEVRRAEAEEDRHPRRPGIRLRRRRQAPLQLRGARDVLTRRPSRYQRERPDRLRIGAFACQAPALWHTME